MTNKPVSRCPVSQRSWLKDARCRMNLDQRAAFRLGARAHIERSTRPSIARLPNLSPTWETSGTAVRPASVGCTSMITTPATAV